MPDWLLPFHSGLPKNTVHFTTNTYTKKYLNVFIIAKTLRQAFVFWISLDQTNLSSVPFFKAGFVVLHHTCSLGFHIAFFLTPIYSSIPPLLICSSIPSFLSQCLLSAVCVVIMMVVLSLRLLVTKEVAPPAFRVVHLFGCSSTLRFPHCLYETETKCKVKMNQLDQERAYFVPNSLIGFIHNLILSPLKKNNNPIFK